MSQAANSIPRADAQPITNSLTRGRKALRLATLALSLLCVFATASLGAQQKNAARSFSLSTSETFSPGESVKIQLYAHNVPALEFRVYKVKDVEKFYTGLRDLHSFGVVPHMPTEQIDEESWLEKLHDWKNDLWHRIRSFFRAQFNMDARDDFREGQGTLGKKSTVVGVSEFAQIPLLNESQLVARWKLVTPPTLVSETQRLPIEGLKQGMYLIEATDGTYKAYTVAIVTQMAIVERERGSNAELFIANRKTGAPIEGADIALWANAKPQSRGKSDTNGFAALAISQYKDTGNGRPTMDNVLILAHHGDDIAVVTPNNFFFDEDIAEDSPGSGLKAYIYTDRPVYRPGHTVHIKAVVRREKDDHVILPTEKTLHLRVLGDSEEVLLQKDLPISAHGTVTTDLTLAPDASLGYHRIEITSNGKDVAGGGNFYVEEYKKPEYQVKVTPTTTRVLQGNKIQAVIEARYFFGEPVANTKVTYTVHTSTHYWWGDGDDSEGDEADADADQGGEGEGGADEGYYGGTEEQEQTGTLDADGRLTINLPVRIDEHGNDLDYRIDARVTDAANREVSGHATVLATYGSFRISVEPTSYVAEQGKPVQVRVTAQDYDGKPIQTAVHVDVSLEHWNRDTQREEKKPVTAQDAQTDATGKALVTLNLSSGGTGDFVVTASAVTPEKRTVKDHTWVWLWGGAGEWYVPNAKAQIITDKKVYAVGDTAHLLLVSGLKEGWAVVTVEGNSLHQRELLHLTSESQAFDVPITGKAEPNVIVTATIVNDDKLMTAQKSLKVPPTAETLNVTATPSKATYLPGEKGSFDVLIKDAAGKPVQADLSFGEVDEALYSVRPDESGDIVKFFYSQKYLYLDPQTSFTFFFTGEAGLKSPLLAKAGDGLFHPRLAEVKPGSDLVVPKVRKAFPDTAYWNPNVRTGVDGHAKVEFTYPDSLTTWRTTIRAMTDDGKAGGAVTRIVVRKNLIVRLAAPRFFRQGDETTLRVIAHNYLTDTKEVTFALDVTGLEIISGQTQKVTIPARGEAFVDWRVRSRITGNAVITAKALSNEESDALEQTIPVKAFGVKQTKPSSGKIAADGGTEANVPYAFPAGSDSGTRGMTVTLAPSIAGTVFDALDYLTGFPYGCTEQTMSGFLPDLIVAQSVDRLHLKSPIDRPTLNAMVKAGIERLYSYQHDDGGWGWWPDDQSRVFMTAYVISGLAQAKAAGYDVDQTKLNNGRNWLISMLKQHPDMLVNLRAYTVYALAISGGTSGGQQDKAIQDALDKLWDSRDKLTDEGVAFAGLAFDAVKDKRADQLTQLLEKRAKQDNGGAHWESFRDELLDFYGDDSPETTAFAIELLVARDPKSPLLPKAAEWLAANRPSSYYWYSTKQTAMVIYGLTRYLESSHELGESSDVSVLVDGKPVATHHFAATDSFNPPVRIFVDANQMGESGQVTIKKTGGGVSYWSIDSHWYTANKSLFHNGEVNLNITRDYYLLKKRQDKPTDPITYDLVPLSGPVHVGDVVAVKLAVSGTAQKYMLTEDPIPAGTEWLDHPELYNINSKPDWWGWWFTRREFHDDRAAYFETDFSGRREYVNLLKVVTPGKFVISPAQSGPMYQPNVLTTTEPANLEVQP
jgi:alpha-2-macroglobulin